MRNKIALDSVFIWLEEYPMRRFRRVNVMWRTGKAKLGKREKGFVTRLE